MPRYRTQIPYTDERGRERSDAVEVNVTRGDPDELARAVEDEWERRHMGRARLQPEDLEWDLVEDEE